MRLLENPVSHIRSVDSIHLDQHK